MGVKTRIRSFTISAPGTDNELTWRFGFVIPGKEYPTFLDGCLKGPQIRYEIYLMNLARPERENAETAVAKVLQGGSNITGTNCDLFTHK
jgi:hypothetical protein